MADVEQLLISTALREQRLVEAQEAGITSAFFVNDRWRKAWEWLTKYYAEHGAAPGESAFKRNFPTAKLADPEEPLSAVVAEMMERRRHRLLRDGMKEAIEAFDNSELHDTDRIDETLAAMQRTLRQVATEISSVDIESSATFMSSFITEVLNMKPMTMLGIPTGFPTIDEASGGLQREQLITIMALPKRGKSSIVLKIALIAVMFGYRVLFFSFEMSNREQKQRYLSLGAEVDLNAIMRGSLSEEEREAIEKFEADSAEWAGELILVHDIMRTTTVGSVDAKVEQIQPDIVIVDGSYMMDDEYGEQKGSSQALTNITRGLKRMAQRRKLPVVNTTQASQARVTKSKGIQMESTMYSQSWAQDSDVLIGLDRDDLMLPVATLKIVAARNALGATTTISLNYNIGVVEESSGAISQVQPVYRQEYSGDDID